MAEWWYVIARDVDGNDYLDGPHGMGIAGEKRAREVGFLTLASKGIAFDVKSFSTRDASEATRQFRHQRLVESSDIRKAVQRVRHTIPSVKLERNHKPIKF